MGTPTVARALHVHPSVASGHPRAFSIDASLENLESSLSLRHYKAICGRPSPDPRRCINVMYYLRRPN